MNAVKKTNWFISSLKQQFIRRSPSQYLIHFLDLAAYFSLVGSHKTWTFQNTMDGSVFHRKQLPWFWAFKSELWKAGRKALNLGNSKQLFSYYQTFTEKSGGRVVTDLKRKTWKTLDETVFDRRTCKREICFIFRAQISWNYMQKYPATCFASDVECLTFFKTLSSN